MRILHYYWTQYNDTEKPGGGVKVYLENIISVQKKDNEVYTLNSGVDYDLSGKCYIKEIKKSNKKNEVKQFSIYNSPMLAPSKCSFFNQKTYINDNTLIYVVKKFLMQYGPFDVIHFHSFEGLSAKVFSLKQIFPKTKFILTIHNYYAFCPQVNMWKNDSCSCDDYHNGTDCVSCIKNLPNTKMVKCNYLLSTYLHKVGLEKYSENIAKTIKQFYGRFKNNILLNQKKTAVIEADDYKKFRDTNIFNINHYFDIVICVSKRVREIAIIFGVLPEKCKVIYIGTKFAERQELKLKYSIDNNLRLLYMGYMRKDKGFYFFIEALGKMPIELAKRIEVVIAARFDDLKMVEKCKQLRTKFRKVELYNGYTHNDIPKITHNINLGIVPVLWEDNLPQVSMEMKSMGIPVLASDKGGASELTESKYFKFKAGDTESLICKISQILEDKDSLNLYYKYGMRLITNEEHCEILNKIYSKR